MIHGLRIIGYVIVILMMGYSDTSAYETCKTSGLRDIKWQFAASTYNVNSSGGPAGTIDAIKAGMQTWTDVATSEFIFTYGGTTASTAHGIYDSSNIVTFGILTFGTLAENRYWYNPATGRLLDSDVRFNTYYTWSATGASGAFDIQNVGTHEHGHSLCLRDLYTGADSAKTMYGYVSPTETKKHTLDQDDIDGITYLYLCPNFPARIEGTSYENDFLQVVYDNAANMDTLQSQGTDFVENLYIDMNKSVYLMAGYDCSYSNNTQISTIHGDMTISDGTLTIQSGTLEVQ